MSKRTSKGAGTPSSSDKKADDAPIITPVAGGGSSDAYAPGAPKDKDVSVALPAVTTPAKKEKTASGPKKPADKKAASAAPSFGTAKKKNRAALWLIAALPLLALAGIGAFAAAVNIGHPKALALKERLPEKIQAVFPAGTTDNAEQEQALGLEPKPEERIPQPNTETPPKQLKEAAVPPLPPKKAPAEQAPMKPVVLPLETVAPVAPAYADAVDSIAVVQAELDAARSAAGSEREAAKRYIASLEKTIREKEVDIYRLKSGREEAAILQESAQLLLKDVSGLYASEQLLHRYLNEPLDAEAEAAVAKELAAGAAPDMAAFVQDEAPTYEAVHRDIIALYKTKNSTATQAFGWDFLPEKLSALLGKWLSVRKDEKNPLQPVRDALKKRDVQAASDAMQRVYIDMDGLQEAKDALARYADMRAAAQRAHDVTQQTLSGKLSGL